MAGELEAAQVAELEQVADVQAVGGGVEAGVDGEPALVEAAAASSGSLTWWIRPRKARSSESVGMGLGCHTPGGLIGRMTSTIPMEGSLPLPMEGALPPDLVGTLFRVGPGVPTGSDPGGPDSPAGGSESDLRVPAGALHAIELRDGMAAFYARRASAADEGVFWHAGSVLALAETGHPLRYDRFLLPEEFRGELPRADRLARPPGGRRWIPDPLLGRRRELGRWRG